MISNSLVGDPGMIMQLASTGPCEYDRPNESLYDIPINQSHVQKIAENGVHSMVSSVMSHIQHQGLSHPTGMPRYSVLRDADSTVIDSGLDMTASEAESGQNRSQCCPEGKPRTQNIHCDLKQGGQRSLRPHSTPATLLWLEENYEIAEGVCIPRSTLYMHYVDFCARNCVQPVNAASFGKIIRQQFPQLTTRRLGTRGQSRYHYYGIGVRETSSYYQLAYSKKGLSSGASDQAKSESSNSGTRSNQGSNIDQAGSNRHRVGAVLPEFPDLSEFKLPESLDSSKASTFMIMYRTHCQRLLDTVVRTNFDEIQTLVLYFWQGIPSHLSSILTSNAFVNIIGICDCILYKTISNLLMPSALQTFPERIIRKFVQEFEYWLKMALYNLPQPLSGLKINLCKRLGSLLRRQASISHLIQAGRMLINGGEIIPQMAQDWKYLNVDVVVRESVANMSKCGIATPPLEVIESVLKELEELLEEDLTIEMFFDWLNSVITRCLMKASKDLVVGPREDSKRFLLAWLSVGGRIIREMTTHSAPSFGSFHLLRLLFDEYLLYVMEFCQIDKYMGELMSSVDTDRAPHYLEDCMVENCDAFLSPKDDYQSSMPRYMMDPTQPQPDAASSVLGEGGLRSQAQLPRLSVSGMSDGSSGTSNEQVIDQSTVFYHHSDVNKDVQASESLYTERKLSPSSPMSTVPASSSGSTASSSSIAFVTHSDGPYHGAFQDHQAHHQAHLQSHQHNFTQSYVETSEDEQSVYQRMMSTSPSSSGYDHIQGMSTSSPIMNGPTHAINHQSMSSMYNVGGSGGGDGASMFAVCSNLKSEEFANYC